jgi:hypothetical protein
VPEIPKRPALVIAPFEHNAAIGLGAAMTAFGALATFVGARAGMREAGVYSALGWVTAAGGALFTLTNLFGTLANIDGLEG